MSRRASLFAKQNPGKSRPKVHFPDELVFLDNIKENDIQALGSMLRRASLQVDISGINDAGLTPLHQAVLDDNMVAVRLLVQHGADLNKQDDDSWTPLHAACAEGHAEIAKYLLTQGADKTILTEDGERPLDLVEPTDLPTIRVMLGERRKGTYSPPPRTMDLSDEENDDEEDEEEEEEDNIDQQNVNITSNRLSKS